MENINVDFHKKNLKMVYGKVISLGTSCRPAYHLKMQKIRTEAYPFDWNITPENSLFDILKNDFKDYFDQNFLEISSIKEKDKFRVIATNLKYKNIFWHDFTKKEFSPEEFKKVKDKYDRRIKRFHNVVNSGENILFIRESINRESAVKLSEFISTKYPKIKYAILATSRQPDAKIDWKIPGVINYYIERKEIDDIESTSDWKALLKKFRFKKRFYLKNIILRQ